MLEGKQGDTWKLECVRTDENGDPVSLTGISILSQIRLGQRVLEFTPTVTSAADGEFELEAAATDTTLASGVPSGTYNFDVQFTDGTVVTSTETIQFKVLFDNSQE